MIALHLPLRGRWVFVDSSAYLALLDETDEHHIEAAEILTRLANARHQLITTNAVLFEAYTLILSALGRSAAVRFLNDLRESQTRLERVRVRDEERARQILLRYDDKAFSFTDALSFAVMERLTIAYAFTFDRHFAQYGFAILTSDQLR